MAKKKPTAPPPSASSSSAAAGPSTGGDLFEGGQLPTFSSTSPQTQPKSSKSKGKAKAKDQDAEEGGEEEEKDSTPDALITDEIDPDLVPAGDPFAVIAALPDDQRTLALDTISQLDSVASSSTADVPEKKESSTYNELKCERDLDFIKRLIKKVDQFQVNLEPDFERVLDCILPILSAKINSRTFRNKSIPGAHLLLDSSPSSARLLRAFFYDWSNIKSRRFFVLGFDEVHQVELPGKLHFDLLELATPEDGSLTYVAEVVPGNQKGANALATSLARIAAERIAKGETGHWRAACFLEVMELLKEKRLLESAHIVVKGIYAGTTEDMRKRGNTYEYKFKKGELQFYEKLAYGTPGKSKPKDEAAIEGSKKIYVAGRISPKFESPTFHLVAEAFTAEVLKTISPWIRSSYLISVELNTQQLKMIPYHVPTDFMDPIIPSWLQNDQKDSAEDHRDKLHLMQNGGYGVHLQRMDRSGSMKVTFVLPTCAIFDCSRLTIVIPVETCRNLGIISPTEPAELLAFKIHLCRSEEKSLLSFSYGEKNFTKVGLVKSNLGAMMNFEVWEKENDVAWGKGYLDGKAVGKKELEKLLESANNTRASRELAKSVSTIKTDRILETSMLPGGKGLPLTCSFRLAKGKQGLTTIFQPSDVYGIPANKTGCRVEQAVLPQRFRALLSTPIPSDNDEEDETEPRTWEDELRNGKTTSPHRQGWFVRRDRTFVIAFETVGIEVSPLDILSQLFYDRYRRGYAVAQDRVWRSQNFKGGDLYLANGVKYEEGRYLGELVSAILGRMKRNENRRKSTGDDEEGEKKNTEVGDGSGKGEKGAEGVRGGASSTDDLGGSSKSVAGGTGGSGGGEGSRSLDTFFGGGGGSSSNALERDGEGGKPESSPDAGTSGQLALSFGGGPPVRISTSPPRKKTTRTSRATTAAGDGSQKLLSFSTSISTSSSQPSSTAAVSPSTPSAPSSSTPAPFVSTRPYPVLGQPSTFYGDNTDLPTTNKLALFLCRSDPTPSVPHIPPIAAQVPPVAPPTAPQVFPVARYVAPRVPAVTPQPAIASPNRFSPIAPTDEEEDDGEEKEGEEKDKMSE